MKKLIFNKMRDNYRLKINRNVFFKPELWNKFYKSLKEKQQPYFKIAIQTGGRIDEIRGLQVQHLCLDQNPPTLIFYNTKIRAKLKETRPTPREIKISTELSHWLRRWIRKFKLKKEDTFFNSSTPAINKAIKTKLKKLGVTNYLDYSSHNIRKTHGNFLMSLNWNGIQICKRLGHDYDTLLKAYVSPDIFSEQDKEIMKEILGDLVK